MDLMRGREVQVGSLHAPGPTRQAGRVQQEAASMQPGGGGGVHASKQASRQANVGWAELVKPRGRGLGL